MVLARPRQAATGTMDFPTDDDKKRQAQRKAQAYQEELNRQVSVRVCVLGGGGGGGEWMGVCVWGE